MAALTFSPLALPLHVDAEGVVRVGSTRVTLDTLVHCYRDGSTAEEIIEQFPSLLLSDVHTAIAYVLTHRTEVDAYLDQRQASAQEIRQEVEKMTDQRGMRERLLARDAARKAQ